LAGGFKSETQYSLSKFKYQKNVLLLIILYLVVFQQASQRVFGCYWVGRYYSCWVICGRLFT